MEIIYHEDPDGVTAGAVAGYFYRRSGVKNINYLPVDHSEEFSINEDYFEGKNVIIVDYYIKDTEDMQKLLDSANSVIWNDHHKTGIELYEGFGTYIEGIRTTERSGCYITWKWFTMDFDIEVPEVVKYVDDYDLWKFEYDETKPFINSLKMYSDLDPSNPIFWDPLIENQESELDKLIQDGNIVEHYKDMWRRKSKYYETKFEGLKVAVMNKMTNSEGFKYIDDGSFDALMTWNFDGTKFNYSIYRAKNSNAEILPIAVKYGGGGHEGAAGFTHETLLLKGED